MRVLRGALGALACLWATQVWADSSASVKILDTRWGLVSLKDGVTPDASFFSRETIAVAACLDTDAGLHCEWDGGPNSGGYAALDTPFASAAAQRSDVAIWVAPPPAGVALLNAYAESTAGAGVGPWTSLTLSFDIDIRAAGDSASASFTYSFTTGSVSVAVTESDPLQGLRTVSLMVANPSDEWLFGHGGSRLAAEGVSPVPEVPSALLLAAGLAGLARSLGGRREVPDLG